MAQITEALIAEFESRLDSNLHINSTVGEERQLIEAWKTWNRRAEQVPEEFDHSIGEGRFYVVQGAYWWHVRVGTGQKNIGAFHTRAKAEEMAMDFLIAFRDGAFSQYQAMLAAAPEGKP